jgi:hypothetical protein
MTVAALVLASAGLARAADKPDPTGTWKWSVDFKGQMLDFALKLELDGDKLTGTFIGQGGREWRIEDGTYKDGEMSFKVTRGQQGNKFITKYKAKVSGDTIKGKVEFNRDGEAQSRDWEARRDKR